MTETDPLVTGIYWKAVCGDCGKTVRISHDGYAALLEVLYTCECGGHAAWFKVTPDGERERPPQEEKATIDLLSICVNANFTADALNESAKYKRMSLDRTPDARLREQKEREAKSQESASVVIRSCVTGIQWARDEIERLKAALGRYIIVSKHPDALPDRRVRLILPQPPGDQYFGTREEAEAAQGKELGLA